METETAAREDLATLSREELTRKYMSAMQEKEELANRLRTAAIEKDEMASQINWLREQLNVLRTRKFSKNSEQVSSLQISLFNEAEDTLDHALPEDLSEDEITKAVPVKKHKNRKISAGSLPVKEIHHELTDRSGMAELKPEKKDYLRYVKGYYYIERHIIHQYVKKDDANDEHTEVYSNTEGVPARLIEGSSVTSSVVAQIANEKYNLATPLYRMEQDCMRNGIPISRQNMSNWPIRCGEDYLETVFDHMHSDLITDAKIIHMDETTKVVIEDKTNGREKSYIWMAMTGKYEPSQMILYFYYESREHRHVEDILGHDYTGYLNSDGFGGYHSYPGAVCCGCWAHYRRKAYEAMISDDNIYSAYNKLHSADERRTFLDGHPSFKIKVALLEKIDQIMKLEPKEEKTSAEEIYQIRQEKALPLIEALFTWTRELEASIPPKSKLGEAVKYGNNEEQYLRNYLLDGHLEITNNRAEREGIKPYVILRKNELFSSTRRGAKYSAIYMTLIASAKLNGLNPQRYLEYVLDFLSTKGLTDENVTAVLPYSKTLPAAVKASNI